MKFKIERKKINENVLGDAGITSETKEEAVAFLKDKYSSKFSYGLENLKRQGVYKAAGFEYNYKPFLKLYRVRRLYGHWEEMYAPNKTLLRKSIAGKLENLEIIRS